MTVVGPLLPVVVLGAIWYLAYGYRATLGLDRLSRRGCLVVAFVVLQLLVAVISEGTSLGRHFTARGVGAAWLLVAVLAVIFAIRLFRRGPGPRVRLRRLMEGVRATSAWARVLAGLAAAELGLLVVIACLYDTPNNGDSLVYHLARVAHWVQNGSVHHYPTHYAAQNELSPLHEFNMAHLHLLGGTDRLDSFVQLLAVVVCVVGASEIARLLGGGRRAQILAAAFTATIPSLILEATSTQNNNFAAATAVGVVVLLLVWRPSGRFLIVAALIGGAVAAGVLAKGTLAVFTATTGLVLVTAAIVEQARGVGVLVIARRVALAGVVVAGVALAVAGPFFTRNVQVYGGLTGPTSRTTLSYDLTPGAATANVIRSVASNFQIGDGTGVQSWISRTVLGGLHWLYQPLNVDPNDWHYMVGTYGDAFSSGDYSGWQRNETLGANPWHVVLIVLALILLTVLVLRGDRRLRVPLLLGLALTASFLIFAATTRWSPYGVRYQLPVLVAWCPLIALLVERAWRAVGAVLMVALLGLATPMLLDNVSKSMLHPTWNQGSGIERYFRTWDLTNIPLRPIAEGEQAVAEVIADTPCTSVGLANQVLFEYPLWVALRNEGWRGRIDDVHVQDPSKSLADPRVGPCALIRQVDGTYVTADPSMTSLQFGPIALSLSPAMVGDQTPDQPGFHSDVLGVRVLPGSGWILGNMEPTVTGSARIYLFSDAARTVRLRVFGFLETTVALNPGVNPLDLPATPGDAPRVTAVSIQPV